MARQIARIKRGGGIPEIEIRFGYANVGAYRVFLWEAGRDAKLLGNTAQPRVRLETPDKLVSATVSYETIIQSPEPGVNQPYCLSVGIHQDGQPVPGGAYRERGKLDPDGAKSVIGFISFELS
jgi:hypothetical protein